LIKIRQAAAMEAYGTELGTACWGNSLPWLQSIESDSVDLVLTSPPFALTRQKAYGNETEENYLHWLLPFTSEIWRILKPSGSLVIELGSAWKKGFPIRSLYQFKVLLALTEREEKPFYLAQDFYWYNPARLPSPAQWVAIKRVRVKDAISPIWWLSKTTNPKADNKRVLKAYSQAQMDLFKNGFNAGLRPSHHRVSKNAFKTDNGGAIPPNLVPAENLLTVANTASQDRYLSACKKFDITVHPARFPPELPHFFISFLTESNDLVVDPFAGSNAVGSSADDLKRHWLACDSDLDYVLGSRYRFDPPPVLTDAFAKAAATLGT
jgi:DNA modification methylase